MAGKSLGFCRDLGLMPSAWITVSSRGTGAADPLLELIWLTQPTLQHAVPTCLRSDEERSNFLIRRREIAEISGFLSLEEFDGDLPEDFPFNSEPVEPLGNYDEPVENKKLETKRKRKKPDSTQSQLAADSLAKDLNDEIIVDSTTSRKKRKAEKTQKLKAGRLTTEFETEDQDGDGCAPESEAVKKIEKAEIDRAGKVGRRGKVKLDVASRVEEHVEHSPLRKSLVDTVSTEDGYSSERGPPTEAEAQLEVDDEENLMEEFDEQVVSQDSHLNEAFDISAWAEMRLHPLLEKALRNLKFSEPTPIQRACIPAAAHKGKDVIGAAETGSGKTLAFGLPILQRLLEEMEKSKLSSSPVQQGIGKRIKRDGPLRALIVSPTRELAMQICEHLKEAAKWTTIKVVPIVGGIGPLKQQRLLSYKPEIVVGTPGRLWELMTNGEAHLLELQSLSFFVLDEADRMVEKGHFKELQSIIDLLPRDHLRSTEAKTKIQAVNDNESVKTDFPRFKKRRQTLVFSATLALPPNFKNKLKNSDKKQKTTNKSLDSVAALSERAGVSHKAAIIDLTSSAVVAKNLSESAVECRDEEKDLHLYYLLKIHGGGRSIVFCTSIAALRRVSALLKILQLPVYPLHAQMQQKQRLKAMDAFKASRDGILVATDVAARGLDVPGIRTVIHYQLPHSAEIYVHRSGRTARASSEGCSIALISPADRAKYITLCNALSRPSGFSPFPIDASYVPACKIHVALAVKVDKLARKDSRSTADAAWVTRNAKEIGVNVPEPTDEDEALASRKLKSRQLRAAQMELEEKLRQPLKSKTFSSSYVTGAGMTPLLAKQLQEYSQLMTRSGSAVKGTGGKKTNKSRFVVIGQEQLDPLEALRLSKQQQVEH